MEGGYFHYLVPEVNGLESREDEWQGRLVAIERTVKFEVQKISRSLKEPLALLDKKMEPIALLEKKMEELTAHCSKVDKETTQDKLQEENWRRRLEDRIDRLESAIDHILQKLDATGPSSS